MPITQEQARKELLKRQALQELERRGSEIPTNVVRKPQATQTPINGGLKEPQQEFIRKSPTFLRFRAQYLKERKKTKDTLVEQIGLSAYNKLIAIPAHEIAKSDLDAAGIKAHQIQTERMEKRKKEGHRRFPDQWLEDEWKEIRNELYLQPEARDEDLRVYPVFNKPGEDINPLAAQVEASKPVEIGTDIGAFVTQLALLKRAMPAATPEMVWEVQGLLTGSKPGEGAATFAAFNLPSKIFPAIKTLGGITARTGKAMTVARTLAESVTLGGIAAVESKVATGEVSWESVAVGAGIPIALKSPGLVRAGIRLRSKKITAQLSPELLSKMPSQREVMKAAKGKKAVTQLLIDKKASEIYDNFISSGNKKLQRKISNYIQGQNLPTIDELYLRVNQGDKVAAEMIQEGLYSSSPEAFLEGMRVEAARQLKVPYTPQPLRSKFEPLIKRTRLFSRRTGTKGTHKGRKRETIEYKGVKEVTTEKRTMGVNTYRTVSGSRKGVTELEVVREGNNYVHAVTGEKVVLETAVKGAAPLTIEGVNKTVANWVDKAKPLNKTVRKQKVHEFRQQQAARVAAKYKYLREQGVPRYKAVLMARSAAKGKASIPEVEPLNLSDAQLDVYSRKIEQVYGTRKPFQMGTATFALEKMQNGRIPTNYEFGILEPILGYETTEKLFKNLATQKDYGIWKYPELIRDGWKAIRFGLDPQVARQLSKTKYRHPGTYYKSLWINIKSIFTKRQHNTIRKAVEADPYYKLGHEEYGLNYLSVAPWSSHAAGTKLQQYGRLADVLLKRKSPTLRFFGRWLHNAEIGADLGTNHALNRLAQKGERDLARFSKRMAAKGKPLSEEAISAWRRQRGKQINVFTKRLVAKNPKAVEIQRAANWILFSPAYTVSPPVADISGVVRLITGKGIANKTYGMQLILSQLSALTAMSGALSYFGLKAKAANPTEEPPVDSSVNPLNTLWGKGRVGNDVFDLSFGDVAPYRLLARIGVSSYLEAQRLLTGKEQRTVAGKKVPTSGEAFLQYMNSKQTLWLGVAKTLLTKKDWLGNPIDLKGTVIENLPFEFFQSFVDAGASDGIWEDMAAGQDIDAAKKAIGNIPVSVASLGGVGTLTYPVPAYQTQKKFKDIVAQNNYGKVWDDLTPQEQGKLQSQHREQFDMFAEKIRAERVEKPVSMERIKEEQFKSGQKIRGLLSKKNKKLMKDIDVTVSRRPKDFYLNDVRYQKYQELTAQYINERMDKIDLTFISDRRRVLLLKNIVKNAKNRAYATLRREMK